MKNVHLLTPLALALVPAVEAASAIYGRGPIIMLRDLIVRWVQASDKHGPRKLHSRRHYDSQRCSIIFWVLSLERLSTFST